MQGLDGGCPHHRPCVPGPAKKMLVLLLSPLQILFLNLVISTPPTMALGIEKPSSTVMEVPPHLKVLFTKKLNLNFVVYDMFLGVLILVLVTYTFDNGDLALQCNTVFNLVECSSIFCAGSTVLISFTWMFLFQAYNCRHLRTSLFISEGGGLGRFLENKVRVVSVFIGSILLFRFIYISPLNTKVLNP